MISVMWVSLALIIKDTELNKTWNCSERERERENHSHGSLLDHYIKQELGPLSKLIDCWGRIVGTYDLFLEGRGTIPPFTPTTLNASMARFSDPQLS